MSLQIGCWQCGQQYFVRDSLAAQRVQCKECGATIEVPVAGGRVIRHNVRSFSDVGDEIATGDSESIEQLTEHIEQYIGPISFVYHELVSSLVHIDIHVITPSDERPYNLLVTTGMSDRPMSVPAGTTNADSPDYGASPFAELLIGLPPDWPLDQSQWDDENSFWPIRWLKMLARFPHAYDTWLGYGHTIPNGDPPEPFAGNTSFCCWLLSESVLCDDRLDVCRLDDGRVVNFYGLYPLYLEEMQFKLRYGVDALSARFEEENVSDLLDIHRANTCLRRWQAG
jgi:ribosomal protein S27E